jgi:hypothetical protein
MYDLHLAEDMDRGRGRGLVSTPVLDSLLAVEDGSPNDGQLFRQVEGTSPVGSGQTGPRETRAELVGDDQKDQEVVVGTEPWALRPSSISHPVSAVSYMPRPSEGRLLRVECYARGNVVRRRVCC